MKVLIVTQVVDTEDPVLGFFVRWIEELAKRFEIVEVICLKLGKSDFPKNVKVYSLGKTEGSKQKAVSSRIRYTLRFFKLVWRLRHDYDTVFVHMNQEYILLGGFLWKLLGKRVYLWRNHYAGSLLTDIAAAFCTKVFCTSTRSYTAKYAKAVLMPVGVDTERFSLGGHDERKLHSVLFLSRIAPSKRPEMLIDALAILAHESLTFTASFVGSPLPEDEAYYDVVKEKVHALGLDELVSFHLSVPNSQTPGLYRAHEIFVNCSPSGMLDKTIFEAAASGCMVLASSTDFKTAAGVDSYFESSAELAELLKKYFINVIVPASHLTGIAENNSLSMLGQRLAEEINI